MNQISELSRLPKGTDVEFKGVVSYENPPRASQYGGGFSQFVVVKDGDNGIGVNISVKSLDEGYTKGTSLQVKGKVDKYPDKKQPLTENGTYPMRTSIKAIVVEEYREVDDFPQQEYDHSKEQVMTKEDIVKADKPESYSVAKNTEKEQERIMWAKKDLITARESACKTVGKWISDKVIELKDYFAWCDKLVDYFYHEDEAFTIITEANLIISGLVELTKPQMLAWIQSKMAGTKFQEEDVLMHELGVKKLSTQVVSELLDTIQKLSLSLGE